MKAKLENGTIKRYIKLPENYKNYIGFDRLNKEVHEKEGFFDVVIPEIDSNIQRRGNLYFDDANNVYTYKVINVVLPTLEEAKTDKLGQLKSAVRGLYDSIQWYLEMHRNNSETIPVTVTYKMKLIRAEYIKQKNAINSLTNVVDVIKYKLPTNAIANLQSQLDSID